MRLFGWAHVDLNHGPRPYQGRALTELSYGPNLDRGVYRTVPLGRQSGPIGAATLGPPFVR